MPDDLTEYVERFRKALHKVLKENNIDPEILFDEHAKHLDYAEDKITDLGENICDHLLACLLFGQDDIDYNHWLDEISGWFINVSRIKLKTNNKSPDISKVKKWLTDGITDSNDKNINISLYNNIITNLINKYTNKQPIGEKLLRKQSKTFLDFYLHVIDICYQSPNINQNLHNCCNEWFNKFFKSYK